jgi:hypothetical protein
MSLMLLVMAAAAQPVSPPGQARAMVRIIRPFRINEEHWKAAKRRSDRVVRNESGRLMPLRTIDFE